MPMHICASKGCRNLRVVLHQGRWATLSSCFQNQCFPPQFPCCWWWNHSWCSRRNSHKDHRVFPGTIWNPVCKYWSHWSHSSVYLLTHLEFRAEFDDEYCLLIPHEYKTILSFDNQIKTHSVDFIWYVFSYALFDLKVFICKLNFSTLKQRKSDYLSSRSIKLCHL